MGPSYPLVGVREGRNVTLTCKVKADPYELDHLHWYNNRGERIDKNYTEDFFGRCQVICFIINKKKCHCSTTYARTDIDVVFYPYGNTAHDMGLPYTLSPYSLT